MFNFKYLHYLAIRKKQVFNETLVGADIWTSALWVGRQAFYQLSYHLSSAHCNYLFNQKKINPDNLAELLRSCLILGDCGSNLDQRKNISSFIDFDLQS
jgi:hypothetical protein